MGPPHDPPTCFLGSYLWALIEGLGSGDQQPIVETSDRECYVGKPKRGSLRDTPKYIKKIRV